MDGQSESYLNDFLIGAGGELTRAKTILEERGTLPLQDKTLVKLKELKGDIDYLLKITKEYLTTDKTYIPSDAMKDMVKFIKREKNVDAEKVKGFIIKRCALPDDHFMSDMELSQQLKKYVAEVQASGTQTENFEAVMFDYERFAYKEIKDGDFWKVNNLAMIQYLHMVQVAYTNDDKETCWLIKLR